MNGTKLYLRSTALAIKGRSHAEEIVIADVNAAGKINADHKKSWSIDVVITSAGLSPLVELAQVSGCPLIYNSDLGGWIPRHDLELKTPLEGLFVSGSVTGVEGSEVAEAQGRLAGFVAADYLGLMPSSIVKENVTTCLAAIITARKKAIAFLPNIERGRNKFYRNRY